MIHVNVKAIIIREHNNKTEVAIQLRKKEGEPSWYELPGGVIDEYESVTDALRRKVLEETGLYVTTIINENEQYYSKSDKSIFEVQCIKPFAAYQTLFGPIDSFGLYFVCNANGEFFESGEESEGAHWASIPEVEFYIKNNKFSDIDKPAIKMFLDEFNK